MGKTFNDILENNPNASRDEHIIERYAFECAKGTKRNRKQAREAKRCSWTDEPEEVEG